MAHQYMPKIFHSPYKNPLINPSYILNVRSLNKIFKAQNLFGDMFFLLTATQPSFTSSKLTIETLEQRVKQVHS